MTVAEQLSEGTRLGNYRIERMLGAGAFADVYLARQVILDRQVALKVIRNSDSEHSEIQGAQIMSRLRHRNIVSVLYAERIDGQLAIAMDFVDGKTLKQVIEESGPLPLERAFNITVEAATALDAIHNFDMTGSAGMAHLDLKPSNVLIDKSDVVKITDFGIAQIFRENQSADARLSGSPAYMAPEQFSGNPTKQSDIWALGILLYQMLTCEPPFRADSLAGYSGLVLTSASALPALLARVPEAARGVIAGCLATNLADRYSSARQLIAAIEQARTPVDPSRVCPKCATPLVAGSDICPECTYSFDKKPAIALPVRKSPVGKALAAKPQLATQTLNVMPLKKSRTWAYALLGFMLIAATAGYVAWRFYPLATPWTPAPPPVTADSQRLQSDWDTILSLESSTSGEYEDRINALQHYVTMHPNAPEAQQAREKLAQWKQDSELFATPDALDKRSDAHMSEILTGWESYLAQRKTDFKKQYATERIDFWKNEIAAYEGYATLAVLSASGLPTGSHVFGSGQSDPFFVLLQDGKSIYKSRTLSKDPAPRWNEKIRVLLKPGLDLTLEVRDKTLFSSRLLVRQNLTPLPRDGVFHIAEGPIEVQLEITRER